MNIALRPHISQDLTRSHKRMSQNLKRCSGLSVRPVSKSHLSTIWTQRALGIKQPNEGTSKLWNMIRLSNLDQGAIREGKLKEK